MEGYEVSFLILVLGGLCIGIQCTLRQSVRLFRCEHQFVSVGFLQVVLGELQGQHAEFGRQLAETFLLLRCEVGPVPDKTVVGVLKQHPFLLTQGFLIRFIIYLLDAGEQFFVQADVVAMFREARHQAFRQGFQFIARLGAEQVAEYSAYTVQ